MNTIFLSVTFQSHYRSDFNMLSLRTILSLEIFQSHYRSDFNFFMKSPTLLIVGYFNPIIGLILTLQEMDNKDAYYNFNPIIGLILTINQEQQQ